MTIAKGLFITLEGGEGAGKTSQSERLASTLEAKGYTVFRTREPGGCELAEHIRGWLLSPDFKAPICPEAELLLFFSARRQHIEERIKPALAAGHIVLCDRFNDSSIAYQGEARGLGFAYVEGLTKALFSDIVPDLTLLFDIDPRMGLERSLRLHKKENTAGDGDKMEAMGLVFHESVRKGYLALASAHPKRIHIIDATQSKDTCFSEALTLVESKLACKRV